MGLVWLLAGLVWSHMAWLTTQIAIDRDVSYIPHLSRLLHLGLVPYIDFPFMYSPGMLVVASWFNFVNQIHYQAMMAFQIFILIVTAILIDRIGKGWGWSVSSRALTLLGYALFSLANGGVGFCSEPYVALCVVAALWGTQQQWSLGKELLWVGVCLGMGLWFKQIAAFSILFFNGYYVFKVSGGVAKKLKSLILLNSVALVPLAISFVAMGVPVLEGFKQIFLLGGNLGQYMQRGESQEQSFFSFLIHNSLVQLTVVSLLVGAIKVPKEQRPRLLGVTAFVACQMIYLLKARFANYFLFIIPGMVLLWGLVWETCSVPQAELKKSKAEALVWLSCFILMIGALALCQQLGVESWMKWSFVGLLGGAKGLTYHQFRPQLADKGARINMAMGLLLIGLTAFLRYDAVSHRSYDLKTQKKMATTLAQMIPSEQANNVIMVPKCIVLYYLANVYPPNWDMSLAFWPQKHKEYAQSEASKGSLFVTRKRDEYDQFYRELGFVEKDSFQALKAQIVLFENKK